MDVRHNKTDHSFTMETRKGDALVSYTLKNGTMLLNHSEVPFELRGQGIGKLLVQKTFEKLTEEGYSAVAVCPFIKVVARGSAKWNSIIG